MRKKIFLFKLVLVLAIFVTTSVSAYANEASKCRTKLPSLDQLSAWTHKQDRSRIKGPVQTAFDKYNIVGQSLLFLAPETEKYVQSIRAYAGYSYITGKNFVLYYEVKKRDSEDGFGKLVPGCNKIEAIPQRYKIWLANLK